MTPTAIRPAAPSLGRLRELLLLFATLRRIRDPITTAEGLRQTIEVVVQLADLVGIDPAWTDRLRSILADPAVLRIVLAIVQYVLGLVESDDPATSAALPMPALEDVALWLPTAIQVIGLARKLDP
jgi:hypothetical protein